MPNKISKVVVAGASAGGLEALTGLVAQLPADFPAPLFIVNHRYRPAIDPLFRSAAVAYGKGVIGIILTGFLDDGTSGMMAIKRCGGICSG